MKPMTQIKMLVAAVLITFCTQSVFAQSKANVFDGQSPITWLGLDYSQAKFIVSVSDENSKELPIPNAEFTQDYIPKWNYLFVMEKKKYDVAKAMHRSEVTYALSVTEKANNAIKKDFYSTSQADFITLTEQNISDLVKNYDYQGNKGIGMLFFVEGMNKVTGEEDVWVTFVNMDAKTVLFTTRLKDKIGGMGFRNNWANPIFKILLQIGANYDSWSK